MGVISYDIATYNGCLVWTKDVNGEWDLSMEIMDLEHAKCLISTNIGAFKQFPDSFINLNSYLTTKDMASITKFAKKKLFDDGFIVQDFRIDINRDEFEINLNAERYK